MGTTIIKQQSYSIRKTKQKINFVLIIIQHTISYSAFLCLDVLGTHFAFKVIMQTLKIWTCCNENAYYKIQNIKSLHIYILHLMLF